MGLLYSFLMLHTAAALADDRTVLVYRFSDGAQRKVVEYQALHLRLNLECEKAKTETGESGAPKAAFDCQAYRALQIVSLKGLAGDDHPGVLVCNREHGRLERATTAEGAEDGFCRFVDGSLVGLGTLAYYAASNDQRQTARRQK